MRWHISMAHAKTGHFCRSGDGHAPTCRFLRSPAAPAPRPAMTPARARAGPCAAVDQGQFVRVDREPAGEEQGVLEARRQLSRARGLDPLAQLRRRWRAGVCGMQAGAFSRNARVHSHQAKLTRETMKGSIVYHGVEGLRTEFRRPSSSPEETAERLDQARTLPPFLPFPRPLDHSKQTKLDSTN